MIQSIVSNDEVARASSIPVGAASLKAILYTGQSECPKEKARSVFCICPARLRTCSKSPRCSSHRSE